MRCFASLLGLLAVSEVPRVVAAEDIVLRSGPARVTLVELFTSEGCSSCPPAETWLGEQRAASGLWKEFVPVALHVNYWDHLGWRDALASKTFTDREHAYAEAWRASSVYTPCFVRNGEEWRPDGATMSATKSAANAGELTLRWNAASRSCALEFAPAKAAKAPRALEVSVALLGGGISTDVRKGENAGRTLRHEFVALSFMNARLSRGETGAWSATVTLPARDDVKASRQAIAAWVSLRDQPAPLQAVGGWLQ